MNPFVACLSSGLLIAVIKNVESLQLIKKKKDLIFSYYYYY